MIPIDQIVSENLYSQDDADSLLGKGFTPDAAREAIGEACMALAPGMTEHEAAAVLAGAHFERGIAPIVVLVAADERLLKYRHPIPMGKRFERTVMLVVCGRRQGLIVSATRIVHFGPLSEKLRNARALLKVHLVFLQGLT